ncbi:hypothetical protein [Parasphingorhabdus halotolerans]|uniref:Uncharacterized protein n=1 Tax=Parasphingorhabdus halotolerans TaxID=2725558 RepID=A0A6H2DH94_9SPHN|nr:hypothetical protein [Parasphingorhabdus halotolerans]QJB68042.1 hypothetical protein HF685_00900 [Parasphingorhabdus halotolerans]
MTSSEKNESEILSGAPLIQNIIDQLAKVLAELDALGSHEIAALRIDEAIHTLSDFVEPQN